MASHLSSLPAELQVAIVELIPQLKAFALTNKTNYQIVTDILLRRAISYNTSCALVKFNSVLRCLCAWASPLALRDLYVASLLSRATMALNKNKEAEATRLVHLLPRLPKLNTRTYVEPAFLAGFLSATRRMVIKALGDKEKFTRLVGYLDVLPQGTVTPTGFFDDTVPHIRARAKEQLEKRRFMAAGYTILLVAQLPTDTKIADEYFDYVISRLKSEALSALNAGHTLSADNILSPIKRLPDHKIAIGCFNDLFHGVRHKAMKQLKACRLRDALDTLSLLHAMPKAGSISNRYFDDVFRNLQTLLEQSIAANKYEDAERIVYHVGRLLPWILGSCVDMTLTIHDQARKAIVAGQLDRAEFVIALVVRFCETSIPKGRFDDLLSWVEERETKASDDGRTTDARALGSAADLLYARCTEETAPLDSVNPEYT